MGFEVYLVGGAVRDNFLDILVYDRDWVVVGATPEMMIAQGYQQIGKDFPVFMHPENKEEYALARTERKTGLGYHSFKVFADSTVCLEDDLIRRDLTINAMAQAKDGTLYDPYGGQKDLNNHLLRHVSAAFSEDPLRVLRVARFAAKLATLGFKLAPETQQLMTKMATNGEISALTPERVWQEVIKALNTPTPSIFFEVLKTVGALKTLFPELDKLRGVTQPEKYDTEGDVWTHTMMALDSSAKLSTDGMVRFSALMHDLGKGLTPKALWPKHHGHEAKGLPLVKAFCERYKVPKKWQQQAIKVTQWHGLIHQGLDSEDQPYLKAKTYLKVLKGCGALKDKAGFLSVLTACEANSKSHLGLADKTYAQKAFWLLLLEVVSQVNNKEIINQGFKGAQIAVAIEQEQVQLIQAFLKDIIML